VAAVNACSNTTSPRDRRTGNTSEGAAREIMGAWGMKNVYRGSPAIPAVRGQAPTILCVVVPREVPGYIRSHSDCTAGEVSMAYRGCIYMILYRYIHTVITLPFLLLPIAICLSVTDLLYVVYGGIWLSPPPPHHQPLWRLPMPGCVPRHPPSAAAVPATASSPSSRYL
jgi:hypothetical protein